MTYRSDHSVLLDGIHFVYRTYVAAPSAGAARKIGRQQLSTIKELQEAKLVVYCAGYTVECPGVRNPRLPSRLQRTDEVGKPIA